MHYWHVVRLIALCLQGPKTKQQLEITTQAWLALGYSSEILRQEGMASIFARPSAPSSFWLLLSDQATTRQPRLVPWAGSQCPQPHKVPSRVTTPSFQDEILLLFPSLHSSGSLSLRPEAIAPFLMTPPGSGTFASCCHLLDLT